jgi:predicted O-methyltransferase YrrM
MTRQRAKSIPFRRGRRRPSAADHDNQTGMPSMQSLRFRIGQFARLLRVKPPFRVIRALVATLTRRAVRRLAAPNGHAELMRELDREGEYTTRWFDGNADEWIQVFQSQRLLDRPIRVLEIGSWEGRSTVFMLRRLPMAKVTAVDTWQGSREHVGDPRIARIEELFDANVAGYGTRLTKVKSTSAEFFRVYEASELFDLIYIDGSHHADDVMADGVGGFDLLAPGGILIFDDYLWDCAVDSRTKPAVAINAFLRTMRGRYRILSVTTQVILKKLS